MPRLFPHLCCGGALTVSGSLVHAASLLLPLSLLNEPLVDDPGHAVVPLQRSGRRPLQVLQPALRLLTRPRRGSVRPAAHPAQELGHQAAPVCAGRSGGQLGGAQVLGWV